jgi:hypothetical protein
MYVPNLETYVPNFEIYVPRFGTYISQGGQKNYSQYPLYLVCIADAN